MTVSFPLNKMFGSVVAHCHIALRFVLVRLVVVAVVSSSSFSSSSSSSSSSSLQIAIS